jgi:hypothetical protein
MSFVDHYLPYFKQQLITLLLSAHLPFWKFAWSSTPCSSSPASAVACQPSTSPGFVYWKFTWRSANCSSPLLQCAQCTPPPVLHVAFQFLGFFFWWGGGGVSLPRGLCWFVPGVAMGVPCAAYLLTCWSASPKQVWSWSLVTWEPSWFLSVMWCGEALYGLGVQGVGVLLLLGGFFLPSVAPVSQQDFWFMELTLSASSL